MSERIPNYINSNSLNSYIKREREANFYERRTALNALVNADIEQETDELRLNVLREIQLLPCDTEEQYDIKRFVYNDGIFRTPEEINAYNARIELKERLEYTRQIEQRNRAYYQSGQYEEDCKEGRLACWTPVFIYIGLFFIGILNPYKFAYLLFFIVFTSPLPFLVTLILQSRHSKKCIELAEKYRIPKNDTTYQNAIITNRTAKLGIIAAGVTALHQGSKGLKSLEHPDSWNVLK